MDSVTIARGEELHPILWGRYQKLNDTLVSQGAILRIVQGRRTWTEQANLYAKGRTSPGVACTHNGVTMNVGDCVVHPFGLTVTKAQPGYTWHNFALALDAVPDDPTLPGWQPDWQTAHPTWQKLLRTAKLFDLAEGAEWRSFPDAPHFYPRELDPTPDDEVRYLFTEGGIQAVWSWFDKKVTP